MCNIEWKKINREGKDEEEERGEGCGSDWIKEEIEASIGDNIVRSL